MPSEFRMIHRIEFSDTDMAGIMHFSHFFRLMERTEHAFFRSLGFSIHTVLDGRTYGWPRVHAECDYRSPLRFEDEVEVRLVVRKKKERSLAYDFHFHRMGHAEGAEVARGSLVVVCVTVEAGRMAAVRIPSQIADQIEEAMEDAPG
jgi:acyl-CoA thioester hydrolase